MAQLRSIFLFWPVAIAAIINANKVDSAWASGQYAFARQASEKAKSLCIIATVIGCLLLVVWLFLMMFVIKNTPNYYP